MPQEVPFVTLQVKITDHLSRNGWVKSLTHDGDVESNPGPDSPQQLQLQQDILRVLQWKHQYLARVTHLQVTNKLDEYCTFTEWLEAMLLSGDIETNPGPLPNCDMCPMPYHLQMIGITLVVLAFLCIDTCLMRKYYLRKLLPNLDEGTNVRGATKKNRT